MEPTLQNGQYLLINKAIYWRMDRISLDGIVSAASGAASDARPAYIFRAPDRGDIVVFRFPRDPSRDFIKRVIAVPGDVVEIRAGRVIVNGRSIDEYYINDQPNYTMAAQQVEPGHYFVLGDNRNNSSDSHVWGQVPADLIIGRAWFSYWPLSVLGVVGEPPLPVGALAP